VKSTMMTMPLSINDILDRAVQLFPNSEVISRLPDKSLPRHRFAEIAERAHALAFALRELGIRQGDRVATLWWNHHVHLECYFGVPLAGAVLHALNLRLAPEEIAWIVADAGSRLLSGGEWISSVALENALMAHPAIAEAAVIGVPHEKWQERPIACVVFKRGQMVSHCDLSAHLARSFAKWQLPDRYEVLTELPRTSTGKFWKHKLRQLFPN